MNNLRYLACELRSKFTDLGYCAETISDMLVSYTYGKQVRYKELLWFCFGWNIVENLKRNVEIKETKDIQCIDCGEWFSVGLRSKTVRCANCQLKFRQEYKKMWNRQKRHQA